MADNSHIPENILQFWRDNPTQYSKDDIHHLEPNSENAVFLKYLLENGFAKLTLNLNGKEIGNFNGQKETDLNIELGTLTVQKNGTTVGTYNGDAAKTVNITAPIITYGTGEPSGGNNGDVYMRYL